jgi:hypothetical protein
MPAVAGPVAIEQPRASAPRRSTPTPVTAKRQDLRPYPDQRRETEDISIATKKERLPDKRLLVINRPPNIQGLTGLLFTNSAYTLPAGKFTVGASLLTEYSSRPEFSVLQIPFTLTYGVTDNLELGIKAKIVDLDAPVYPDRAHGFGDSEISAKWRFASRRFILPDMAVGLSYIAPTGNENKHLNEVVNWGMKLMRSHRSRAGQLEGALWGYTRKRRPCSSMNWPSAAVRHLARSGTASSTAAFSSP